MTELTVIRHGETDSNREHRFQGQLDVPLNDTGLAQAERLAHRLVQEHFDAAVVSDLWRTRQTLAPLAAMLDLPVQPEPAWREQSFGRYEGVQVPAMHRDEPDMFARWARHDADFAFPGGESVRHFHARIVQALQSLVAAHGGRRVLLVTHGGVLDMLWRTAQGLPLDGPRECAIPNAGINRLRWSQGRLEVLAWGDDAHLAGLPVQPSTVPLSVRLREQGEQGARDLQP